MPTLILGESTLHFGLFFTSSFLVLLLLHLPTFFAGEADFAIEDDTVLLTFQGFCLWVLVEVHLDATALGGGYKSTVWLMAVSFHTGCSLLLDLACSINLLSIIIANIIK